MKTESSMVLMPPEPRQIFNLAEIAIGISLENGRFKPVVRLEKAHIFYVGDIENYYQVPDERLDQTGLYVGKIAKVGFGNWQMSMVKRYNQIADAQITGYRVGYIFDWTKNRVIKAQQRIINDFDDGHVKPGNLAYEDYVDPDLLQVGYLFGIDEAMRVSAEDCEELISEIKVRHRT